MNRIAKRLAMAGLLVMFACSGSTTGSALPPEILTLNFTLQGIVADAITGARLGGDIKLYLIQGATIRGPERLITATGDPLQGEYAFTGIPVEFNSFSDTGGPTNNSTWKVVAIKTGYQRFESELSFQVNLNGNNIIDAVYNKIGNIFMFPLGTNAPDYNFTVYYNGKPVSGATVELDPVTASNTPKFSETVGDTLPNNTGYVPGIQSTATDASGKTTVAAANNLVLGGAYRVSALPVVFTDSAGTKVQLALTFAPGTLFVGLAGSNVNQVINMTALSPGNGATPLYIASASNLPAGQVQANGQLSITFNAPVTLIAPTSPPATTFSAILTNGTLADGTAAAGALNAPPVTATLSTDGLTLTLAPSYATPPNGVHGVIIGYGNGNASVSPKDYPALSFNVFGGLHFADGTTPASGVVHITGP